MSSRARLLDPFAKSSYTGKLEDGRQRGYLRSFFAMQRLVHHLNCHSCRHIGPVKSTNLDKGSARSEQQSHSAGSVYFEATCRYNAYGRHVCMHPKLRKSNRRVRKHGRETKNLNFYRTWRAIVSWHFAINAKAIKWHSTYSAAIIIHLPFPSGDRVPFLDSNFHAGPLRVD